MLFKFENSIFYYNKIIYHFIPLQERKVLIRGGPITITALEKARGWPRTNHIDDILSRCGLVDLAIIGHVQQDLPLLTALAN